MILVHPASLRWLMRLAGKIFRRPFPEPNLRFFQVVMAFLLAFTASLVAGAAIYCLVRSLVPEVGPDRIIYLASAFAFSWTTGFLTPIAPSGLGVREGLLVVFFQRLMPLEVATVLAVALRLLFVVEDLFWAGFARVFLESTSQQPGRNSK